MNLWLLGLAVTLATLGVSYLNGYARVDEDLFAVEQAEWLPEVLHVVWGFAMREHEGPAPQLVPGHAEEALRRVPGEVLDAARIARGES